MKQLSQPVQILKINQDNANTILTVGLTLPKEEVLKYQSPDGIYALLKLYDARIITAEQRKKIYATIKDIADYIGDFPEFVKEELKFQFCLDSGLDYFSLSDCSLEVAREFINYLIEYVIENDIPLTELAIERTEDISRYLFNTVKFKKCCICGKQGIVYTLTDKSKICMCDIHHDQAKVKGLEKFEKLYKVYGINYIE